MKLLWTFVFLLQSSTCYALSLPPSHQTVLGPESPSIGVLKRYTALPAEGWDVESIVETAQAINADIWQIGPSHVDIYFPDELPAAPLLNFTHTTTELRKPSLSARPPSDTWNLSSFSNTTFHAAYHPLYEIEGFMQEMAALYPDLIELTGIGHSGEGREMSAMKISAPDKSVMSSSKSKVKQGFVITGAQHSREWIATSTALYLIHSLVANSAEPYAMSSLLDSYDFYVVPVPNPDGYVYTWEHDRFWYKNRQIVGPNEKCIGLDMNRNWGYKWKAKAEKPSFNISDVDVSKTSPPVDPCSHWFPGHRPFESPEVNNIANYITTLPALRAFVDLRSYGQMVSTPFSHSCKKTPKDAEDLIEAALGASRAIKAAHGTAYTTGSLCRTLYKASGNVVDWMYAKAGIKFSYSVHLRDTGTYGFALPAEWIRPVGEESSNMIRFLAGFIGSKKVRN